MNKQKKYPDTFSRFDLFAGIENDILSDIFSFGHQRVYKSGVTLFREGDPTIQSYLVLKGRLKLSKRIKTARRPLFAISTPAR